jgi:hypothetical protein
MPTTRNNKSGATGPMDAHILRRNLFQHHTRTNFEEESGFGDDDTQKTGNQSDKAQSESSFSMPSKMEHTLKLQFMAPTALQEDKMAACVSAVFEAIQQRFADKVEIYTNKTPSDSIQQAIFTGPHLRSEFIIHSKPGSNRNNKTQKSSTWIIFKVRTSTKLHELRNNYGVKEALNKSNGSLTKWHFDETVWDVVPLGFIVRENPKDTTSTQFESIIQTEIEHHTKVPKVNQPAFKCRMTNVTAVWDGRRTWSTAYEIQVERSSAKKLLQLLAKTTVSSKKVIVMTYSMKHKAPEQYFRAVFAQNKFITTHSRITVDGLGMTQMTKFQDTLQQSFPEIKSVYATNKTAHIGRYFLTCLLSDKELLQEKLTNNLATMYAQHNDNNKNINSHELPPIKIHQHAGKANADDNSTIPSDDSDMNSKESLASFYQASFSAEEFSFENFPELQSLPSQVIHPTQTEPSVTTSITEQRSYAEVTQNNRTMQQPQASTLEEGELLHVQQHMADLQQEVTSLKDLVQQLVHLMTQQQLDSIPEFTSPPRKKSKEQDEHPKSNSTPPQNHQDGDSPMQEDLPGDSNNE